jgi:hypothetical protein
MTAFIKYPFGAPDVVTLPARAPADIPIVSNFTIIDGLSVPGTYRRRLKLTPIDERLPVGSILKILLQCASAGATARQTVFATGFNNAPASAELIQNKFASMDFILDPTRKFTPIAPIYKEA